MALYHPSPFQEYDSSWQKSRLNSHVMVKEYDLREGADRWRVSRPHSTLNIHSLTYMFTQCCIFLGSLLKKHSFFAYGLSVLYNATVVDTGKKNIKESRLKLKVSFVRPWVLKMSNLRSRRPCVCSHVANVIQCVSSIGCTYRWYYVKEKLTGVIK